VTVLAGLVPVFLLLAMGAAVRHWKLIGDEAANGLNRLVANLALPALLVLKIGTADLRQSFSLRLVATTSALLVVIVAAALLGAAGMRLPRNQRGVLAQAAMRGNLAYVAFPVILGTLGEKGLEQAAVTAAVLIPLMNLLAVGLLEGYRGERAEPGLAVLGRVAANPLVISALGGLALGSLGWKPWGWLAATLRVLSDFALPGALLALGAQLKLKSLGSVWRPTVLAAVLKLGLQPLAAFWALRALGVSGTPLGVGVLLLAAPTAVASYPVAADLGGDTDLAGACVLVSTLAGLAGYLAWTMAVAS
jgi:malate permease and related proteins